jgi:hypothetical protein
MDLQMAIDLWRARFGYHWTGVEDSCSIESDAVWCEIRDELGKQWLLLRMRPAIRSWQQIPKAKYLYKLRTDTDATKT